MASDTASVPATIPASPKGSSEGSASGLPGRDDDVSRKLAELVAEYGAYPVRQVRPWTRTALRVALWGSVVLGIVGGLVGLFSLGGGRDGGTPTAEPVVALDEPAVPAPVGSMAELVAEQWLAASEADPARVADLFVEPPALAPAEVSDWRQVVQARTVAAEQVTEGYWAVTVRVELVEWAGAGGGDTSDATSAAIGSADVPASEGELGSGGVDQLIWYVEVGIVGEADGALAALRTPAVLPGPPEVAEGWSSQAADGRDVPLNDPMADALEDFLLAVLAGEGDLSNFLSPGAADSVVAATPPLFAGLQLTHLVVEDESPSTIRAQLFVEAVTVTGSVQPAAYEVVAERRGDRIEVLEFWGAASLRGRPQVPEDELRDPASVDLDLDLDALNLTDPIGGDGTDDGAEPHG